MSYWIKVKMIGWQTKVAVTKGGCYMILAIVEGGKKCSLGDSLVKVLEVNNAKFSHGLDCDN